jgi:hypothetical protein
VSLPLAISLSVFDKIARCIADHSLEFCHIGVCARSSVFNHLTVHMIYFAVYEWGLSICLPQPLGQTLTSQSLVPHSPHTPLVQILGTQQSILVLILVVPQALLLCFLSDNLM